ncbi:MAG: hypothetical protein IT376_12825 [Polyangiaceae bacterium]|nr:hypothetical protein [Polyangiaceae bacterium]
MGALDELLQRWRANPDADATVAIAAVIGTAGNEEMVREVGACAETWHFTDPGVMLAAGRMYLEAQLLPEAQAALVAAGKAAPSDGRVFRFLGEVLLRRGDAVRADKVLAKAITLGQTDAATRLWHDRSTVYSALQKRVGPAAVAAEVQRSLPKTPSVLPGPVPPMDSWPGGDEAPTNPKGHAVPIPRAPNPPMLAPVPPAYGAPIARAPAPTVPVAPPTAPVIRALEPTPPPLPVAPPVSTASPGAFVTHAASPLTGAPAVPPPLHAPAAVGGLPAAVRLPEGALRGFDAPAQPSAEEVLDALARVGVYEPGGGAPPAWERAPRARSRGGWVLLGAIVLAVGGAGGGFAYATHMKAKRAAEAKALEAEVATLLASARPEDLATSDTKLAAAFELDSRSREAARLWLDNRVISALVLRGEARGLDAAYHRARSLEIPEAEVVHGKVASFLAEGDLAGAAALLQKWDAQAGRIALYQVVAGAALERAGDTRALERYEAATRLDERMVLPRLLLAQLALLELGPERARPLVEDARKVAGDTPAVRVLAGLAWALDPEHPPEPPEGALPPPDVQAKLPAPLAATPHYVAAARALYGDSREELEGAISRGIEASSTPPMATRFGLLAVQAGDEQLARRAALRALQLSALYARARVLAARVALLGGRLDEARKAIEELDPSPDIAVVRAVLAYEALDPAGMATALEPLGPQPHSDLSALVAGPRMLRGEAYPDTATLERLASPGAPWGEPVAIDAALDQGQLDVADRIVGDWARPAARPSYALRAARLRRYQGKTAEAVSLSAAALEGTATKGALVERVYALLAADQAKSAGELVARHPSLLGPLTAWLEVLVLASSAKVADANVKCAQQELPPEGAPVVLRVLAARALAAAGDRRAKAYVQALSKAFPKHPDLALAKDAR